MQLPKISTYNGTHSPNRFYVLCKGENSGKPMKDPCPNCFSIECNSVDDFNYWFWLSWGLWKSKRFHVYLRGSVIPFIRICDYKALISESSQSIGDRSEKMFKALESMQEIEQREESIRKQLVLFGELKIAIFRKLLLV